MNLIEADLLAKQLIAQHCPEYSFKFINTKKVFGNCHYRLKRIGLSREITELNDVPVVRDTILHEIAHALAGKQAAHGWRWKMVAKSIGAEPTRCYDTDVTQPKGRYTLVCPACHKEYYYHRKLKRKQGCIDCCNTHNHGRFSYTYALEPRPGEASPYTAKRIVEQKPFFRLARYDKEKSV